METCVFLSHKKPDSLINVKVEFGEGEGKISLGKISERAENYKPKEKVTYKMIQQYVKEKYDLLTHTASIAEVKRKLGLPVTDAYNLVEVNKYPKKYTTPEKAQAIEEALKYFSYYRYIKNRLRDIFVGVFLAVENNPYILNKTLDGV